MEEDPDVLGRAKAGDQSAFDELVAPHRRELHAHCYRMLGSVHDAEDALQEALLSAWRAMPRFEARSSVRVWLYRIATNSCLDALRAARRRPPAVTTIRGTTPPEPSSLGEVAWLEPYPDSLLEAAPAVPGPEAALNTRESIALAFITALQLLPPRQRAVLILRDVLGYRAREVAGMLGTSAESVTSALKRARATLASRRGGEAERPAPGSAAERALVDRFVDAFTVHDVDGLVALLTEDATVSMPPMPFEYKGTAAAERFFASIRPRAARQVAVVRTRANGDPAIAPYVHDDTTGLWRSIGVIVLTPGRDGLRGITHFQEATLASFRLPVTLASVPSR
ncbi:RNA polymerase subunit sigma-70 [Sinomonas sp. ASV486]|uniref:RNA polymerase subunit sigma-70 n=1 Tax=Sinomonas sp. ASV486 TaxID=3051170 RepID=UPI0027DDC561|nr:RNA polymerase subunit sigma-70 [Sinomonas sp. ASV486]MDQ4490402.1 RNA polymerase subunit sigma-70 [Sinomonas sp. ASV486]